MNRYRAWMILVIIVSVSLNGGCWGRKFFRAPGETIEISAKVDSLLKENMVLQRRVYQVEQILVSQQDYTRGVNAQNKIDLEELKDQINALTQAVGDSGSPVRRWTPSSAATGTKVYQDTASSVDSIPVSGDEAGVLPDSGLVTRQPVVEENDAMPSPEEIHRQIYLDFSRMEYKVALDESEMFLERYGTHPLGEEVRFIRGECFMELGQYFDALKEFSAILQQYPGGRRKPSSLLRMAISYEKIGDRDLAVGVARRLVREHPGSEEASEARERFSDLLDE
ncbi:MAG: tetratricopeptide repeat protein [Candidatus Krumholzibacteria bacterium]|nr:tetratricopeptide repeat protein [Candidatus Krumholzibacteria bacterium]